MDEKDEKIDYSAFSAAPGRPKSGKDRSELLRESQERTRAKRKDQGKKTLQIPATELTQSKLSRYKADHDLKSQEKVMEHVFTYVERIESELMAARVKIEAMEQDLAKERSKSIWQRLKP